MKRKNIIITISLSLNLLLLIYFISANHSDGKIKVNTIKTAIDSQNIVSYDVCFDAFGIVRTPHLKKIQNDSFYYEATIGLYVYNTEGDKPYILLSDSINNQGKLIGKIDTITTEYWRGEIAKKYPLKENQKICGKYFYKFKSDSNYQSLDFSFPINTTEVNN